MSVSATAGTNATSGDLHVRVVCMSGRMHLGDCVSADNTCHARCVHVCHEMIFHASRLVMDSDGLHVYGSTGCCSQALHECAVCSRHDAEQNACWASSNMHGSTLCADLVHATTVGRVQHHCPVWWPMAVAEATLQGLMVCIGPQVFATAVSAAWGCAFNARAGRLGQYLVQQTMARCLQCG